MNTNEVKAVLKNIVRGRRVTCDVVACDQLEKYRNGPFPIALVVNSRESSHGGEHWLAIYCANKKSPVEFFCSYGLGLDSYQQYFVNFARGRKVIQNKVQLQSTDSKVCGKYAIYYLWKRVNNQSLTSVYCRFSNNFHVNDKMVSNFFNRFLFKNKKM